eukprot:96997_1
MEPHIVFNIIFVILCDIILSQSLSCYYHTKSLPIPLYGHIAVYSNFSNSIYIFGGKSPNVSNIIYKWDLNTPNSWFKSIGTTPVPFFSYGNNAIIANDIVYFIGIQDLTIASGNIYLFDIKTESWMSNTQLRTPTMPLSHGCLVTNSSHIFMLDGLNDNLNDPRSPVLQIYEITTNIWTGWSLNGLGSYTGGWRYQYCAMLNNYLYILGGRIASTSSPAYSNKIYEYDAITETMTLLDATLPISQSWGVAMHYNNFIYTVGSFPYTFNINVFDINTETVTNTTYQMTQKLAAPASVILNDKLYIFGGEDDTFTALATVQICNLETKNPTTIPTAYTDQPSVFPSVLPITLQPSINPSDAAVPTLTITNKPTTSLKIEYTTSSSVSDTIPSSMDHILTSESYMYKNERDNSSSIDVTLILGIVGVIILCLILLFCILIYFRLRKPSNKEEGKKTHIKVVSTSSLSVNLKHIDANDIELEKMNPGNSNQSNDDILTNPNDMNETNDMYNGSPKYAVVPGEMMRASIELNDGENEGFEGVGITDGMEESLPEIKNEFSKSEYDSDSDNDNEMYKKGNKTTKGNNDQNESDNELYGKGNSATKGGNDQNGNNDDLLNESEDNNNQNFV